MLTALTARHDVLHESSLCLWLVRSLLADSQNKSGLDEKKCGGAGYRSLCLLHAKQALYHVSYTPIGSALHQASRHRLFSVE